MQEPDVHPEMDTHVCYSGIVKISCYMLSLIICMPVKCNISVIRSWGKLNQFPFSYRLENLEEDLIKKKVKLIVIDSMASLIRKEFDSHLGKNLVERTQLLSKEAALLKYIAESFKIPVSNTLPYYVISAIRICLENLRINRLLVIVTFAGLL